MVHHHHHHRPAHTRHHHVSHPHHHHHAHKHPHVHHPHHKHHRRHGKSEIHKAFDFVSDGIVKPVYNDLVHKPLETIESVPSRTFDSYDKTVGLFSSPTFVIVGGLVVALLVLKK